MKNIILLLLSVLGLSHAMAQNYEYVPFVREGVKWVYSCDNSLAYDNFLPIGTSYFKFEMKGDTIIDGKHYKPVHLYSGEEINEQNDTIPVFLREENKVVYAYIPEGQRYWECPVGIGQIIDIPIEHTHWTWTTGEEHILYDFNDIEGFYDYCESSTDGAVFGFEYVDTDTIQLFNHLSKRHCFKTGHINTYYEYIIESVGFVGSFGMPLTFFYQPTTGFPVGYRLKQVIDHGKVIYNDGDYPFKYEYVPFVREGVKWVCSTKNWYSMDCGKEITFELLGDSVINGNSYKAMHKYSGGAINPENDTILAYLREVEKIVYAIVPEGKTYDGFPIGMGRDSVMISKRDNGEEFVLYDFNDPVAFIQNSFNHTLETTQITIAGKRVNRYIFYPGWGLDNLCLIEGVGCDGLFGGNPMGSNGGPQLNRVIENGDVIYVAEMNHYKPESDNELPIPRQGVQWVNERVTVEEGDTTCYYYKYEFKGYDSQGYGRCYSYTGETLNTSTAINAAQYQCWDYSVNTSNGMIRNNYPFSKVKSENRDMVYYDSSLGSNYLEMYHFDLYSYSDISSEFPPKYYMGRQKENFLNRQNFVRVEPLIIQDVLCDRFAYIGENGDTLAYVVEGIGFDSRDMGDLLTPFTRRPDPTADHQEWCGLSHVIKDGQIIYKGMRYREGAFDGIDEVVVDKPRVVLDPNYYNLMGQPVGKEVPTTPGIYIHQGKKICVSRIP